MELNTTIYNRTLAAERVLLVGPSLGGNATHQWTKVAAALIDDARVVFVDLPGSGLSEPWNDGDEATLDTVAAAIADVARAQKAELGDVPVYYAGLSISGATGLHLARDYDDLFAGIIVVASAATVGEPARWIARAEQVEATGTQQLVDETTKRWFTADFRAEQADTVAIIMEGLSSSEDHSYAQLCRALAVHDMRADLPYIQTPVMMIAGERDSSTPSRTSNSWPRRRRAASCTSSRAPPTRCR
ncbi:alpha/beta fold hydrolase [Tessaracoccus sp. HDW20]|uniref:alpha/beta fold hydrolase n=1 Tax=Tessaracoccus coleopterorum TaxID=2714950 RepID=UPI0018D44EE9|nr:alpha/beta hydrolase [Tessaracoccus coleopterorum]NHB85566.1 alpha/beta fold hydrolase [Tessaracoccus coleopterorum]